MLLVLIILALIIAIIVSSIQYYKAYARLHSHTTFDEAAKKQMTKIRYKDPVISCDYCGAAIDTSKHKICPQCGADYSKDEEWVKRFRVDQDWVDEEAEKEAAKEIAKAEAAAKKIAKRIKRLIIIIVIIIAGFLALAAVVTILDKQDRYAKSEELNDYSTQDYQKTDYDIVGDGILIDRDGILVQIEGIYYDQKYNTMKIKYHIQNNNNEDRMISMQGLAVNGYAHIFSFFYSTFKKNADITMYGRIYDISEIKTLAFGDISIRDTDYDTIYTSEDVISFETDINDDAEPEFSEGTLLFENDYVTIMGLGYDKDDNYAYEILNKTDETLKVICRDGKFKKNSTTVYGSNAGTIPAKCIYNDATIHVYEDDFADRAEDELLSVNFEFTDAEKPEYDFSTGYIDMK